MKKTGGGYQTTGQRKLVTLTTTDVEPFAKECFMKTGKQKEELSGEFGSAQSFAEEGSIEHQQLPIWRQILGRNRSNILRLSTKKNNSQISLLRFPYCLHNDHE